MSLSSRSNDTIAAISTATIQAAIGLVRLSGPGSLQIASKIFKPSKGGTKAPQKTFSMRHGQILNKKGQQLDEVLVSYMKAPKSYTAEDVIEINCHGGPLALRSVLENVLHHGARLAEPGEFTKRAYLNGRIDLVQAEAVADIIEAKTELALKAAQGQLQGRLSLVINELRKHLIDVSVQLQAAIDFSDEDIEPESYAALVKTLNQCAQEIKKLLETKNDGRFLREGVKTAIIGAPNVGKSCLLNALLQRERAIVTASAGTTRDLIEEIINVDGLPLVLQDTAGIRDAFDEAEKLGIEVSKKAMAQADLVLLVIDSTKKLGKTEKQLLNEISKEKCILVLNKSDLGKLVAEKELMTNKTLPTIRVSALEQTGLDSLKKKITSTCLKSEIQTEEVLVSNIRHTQALEEGLGHIQEAKELLEGAESEEIVAFEVRTAIEKLSSIVGEVTTEDILDQLFSSFCIGK